MSNAVLTVDFYHALYYVVYAGVTYYVTYDA